VREALQAKKDSGKSVNAMAKETGIPNSCLLAVLKGDEVRSKTLNRLLRYLELWDAELGKWIG
jgi:predicted transcriptional regulator